MFEGKHVLITGATGSFGNAFVGHLLCNDPPDRLTCFSRDEAKQETMAQKFPRSRYPAMRYRIGDVRDYGRLLEAMRSVDYVVHAAALKRVPACEYNPFEAAATNVIGTENVIRAAIERGVQRIVLVSSDKATEPVNLYGATKMCAERLVIAGNIMSGQKTLCSVVRYGNVTGSRGSVIPKWLELIRANHPITVTCPDMTRYMITLKQGVALVCWAMEHMRGGEVFVPDLPAYKISDLAEAVASFAGLSGATFEVTGVRPGEKIHESLVSNHEKEHARILGCEDLGHAICIIEPEHYWFEASWKNIATAFKYDSAHYHQGFLRSDNARRMSADDLIAMIKEEDL